jgi:hypothetical protein
MSARSKDDEEVRDAPAVGKGALSDRSIWTRFVTWADAIFSGDSTSRRRKRVRRDATVRRTRQLTESDCGIAALSMIANVPYAEARKALFGEERCRDGTSYARMLKALTRFGVPHGKTFRQFQSWEAIPSHALVHIEWVDSLATDPGHWVVFQRTTRGHRVLDPASFADTLTAANTDSMRGVRFCPLSLVERVARSRPSSASPNRPRPRPRAK